MVRVEAAGVSGDTCKTVLRASMSSSAETATLDARLFVCMHISIHSEAVYVLPDGYCLHTLHKLLILAPHVEQLTQPKPKWKKLEASKTTWMGLD